MDCSMPGFPAHHQLPELSQTQGFPSNTLLYPHPAPFLPASITPGHHESVTHLYNFIIKEMEICSTYLLRWALFTHCNSLEIHPQCCMYQWFLPSWGWAVFHYIKTVCPPALLMDSGDFPYCWLLRIKPFWLLLFKSADGHICCFSWVNT